MIARSLTVNGTMHTFQIPPETPLLAVLRERLGLRGAKIGCAHGECGSCTILMDGAAHRACAMTIEQADGRNIITIEGLGTPARPHPLQAAFIADQATQCGYCVTGMILSAKALLDRVEHPSDAEIRDALNGNICRCGSHARVIAAVRRASTGGG